MKIAVYSNRKYTQTSFAEVNKKYHFEFTYFEGTITTDTVKLAKNFDAVCVFVNDAIDSDIMKGLSMQGVKLIALRCAGFNNVDLEAAEKYGIKVVRVPAYSPYAVAEHTAALILSLNRKIHKAYNRVREGNFALDGLMGFDIHGLTVGIIGTGKIGRLVINIMKGFGCNIIAYDKYPNDETRELGAEYVDLKTLFAQSDIISLHCPLTPETEHVIDNKAMELMKQGVMLINTSRGRLVDTKAVLDGLKSGKIGNLALDVYEEEEHLFFEDLSDQIIQDDVFTRLQTFPNVLVTGHQAFFTKNAVTSIAETTLKNIYDFANGNPLENEVKAKKP